MPHSRKVRSLVLHLLALALVLGVASGCEEDDSEVTTTMSGEGTMESPYIIQYGQAYEEVPIPPAGSAFFLAENVPAGPSNVNTASVVDVDLTVFGFQTLFGSDGAGGSYTPATGTENFGALGDGVSTDLFFMVDGTHVRTGGASFNVSVLASSPVLASRTFNLGPFGSTSFFSDEFGFAMVPGTSLSITMENTTGQLMRVEAYDQDDVWISTIQNSGYSSGTCTVNYIAPTPPFTPSPSICTVSPIAGYQGLKRLNIYNQTGSPGDLTITFNTP